MPENPWLGIPWQDYEGHMSSPEVGQLQLLGTIFREALTTYRPRSVAILGCATGNGLEHVDPEVTRSVVGVDFNTAYLAVARRRFGGSLAGLALVACDLRRFECRAASFDLVFGGLIFEYLDPAPLIGRVAGWLAPAGALVAVIQLPFASGKVSATAYASLRRLEPTMQLIDPDSLHRVAERAGLSVVEATVHRTPAGKPMHVAYLGRSMRLPASDKGC